MTDGPAGRRLDGRYALVAEVGGGGAASVWRALDTQTGATVAVKLLHPKHQATSSIRARLAREAALLGAFDHPNLALALAFGLEHPEPYFVMELIEGRSMQDEIADRAGIDRHFAAEELLGLVSQMVEGVAYAHRQGVVHRDLKPANVMLTAHTPPVLKVLDFGIAKLLEHTDPGFQTTRGRVLGSGFYMAPEQALGKGVSEASDVFAMASVVLEMLTLRRAWVRSHTGGLVRAFSEPARMNDYNEPGAVLRRIAAEPRLRASEMRPGLSAEVDAVFARALAIQPSERTRKPQAFLQDLQAALRAMGALPVAKGLEGIPRGGTEARPSESGRASTAARSSEPLRASTAARPSAPAPHTVPQTAARASDPVPGTAARPARTAVRAPTPTDPLWVPDVDEQVRPQPLDQNESPSRVGRAPEATIASPTVVPARPAPAATAIVDTVVKAPTEAPVAATAVVPPPRAASRRVWLELATLVAVALAFWGGRALVRSVRGGPAPALAASSTAASAAPTPGPASARPPTPSVAPKVAPTAAPPPPPVVVPAAAAPTPTPAPRRESVTEAPRTSPKTPSPRRARPPSAPTPKPAAGPDRRLRGRLEAVRAAPSDVEGLAALAAEIKAVAGRVQDPKVRARIRRLAESGALVGDVEEVARALRLLEAQP